MSDTLKCGFVTILGEPNAGKSTLVNQLVGQKVSIVTHKVQTTRNRIIGVAIQDNTQFVLVDTPGIFTPKKTLEKAMVTCAWESVADADVKLVLFDVTRKKTGQTHDILKRLTESSSKAPIFLVLNKIDLVDKQKLLSLAQEFSQYPVAGTFMISALNRDGVDALLTNVSEHLPEGPWLYPEDDITDMPQRLWAAEITREQLMLQLHQELPYESMVETEAWEEFDNGSVKINQVVYLSRENHKAMVLGKSGQRIKEISKRAREELSRQLDRQVHLFLHVKVVKNWMEKPAYHKLMGLI